MADRILPRVRLLIPCDEVVRREADGKWVLYNPWSVVALPPGAQFPFDLAEMWLYTQLTEGIGEFDLHVEARIVSVDESRKVTHRGKPMPTEFPGGRQLQVIETVFHLTKMSFNGPGLYEFQVWAPHVALNGQTSSIRVFGSRDKL